MIPVLFLRRFFKYSPLDLLQGALYNREKTFEPLLLLRPAQLRNGRKGLQPASPHPPRRRLSMSRPRSNDFFH